ncbi:MAG: SMP-30/gluconolactonase/LRE family protein [Pseudomonadota bacterium]
MPRHYFFAVFAAFLLCITELNAEPILDCEPKGNARPICDFSNPEDIVALPGDEAILIGEYGASAEAKGRLVVFEIASEKQHTVFRGGQGKSVAESGWGDPSCTTPPDETFNSHGIDLVRRDDGRLQLLVIQHGNREAVELFEVMGEGRNWRVAWRGCVPSPPNASLNSVAALPNGDFYTTQMIPLEPRIDIRKSIPRHITGHVFAWSQSKASFSKIEGTDGAMPNGIVVSPDGRYIYMNATAEHSVRKVEVATGRELARATVDTPDNARWSPDGRVLISSLDKDLTGPDFAACVSLKRGACSIPFKIVALDPDSMTIVETLYESTGAPMGAGTVGLRVGDDLFIGTFHGDRILRVNLKTE